MEVFVLQCVAKEGGGSKSQRWGVKIPKVEYFTPPSAWLRYLSFVKIFPTESVGR